MGTGRRNNGIGWVYLLRCGWHYKIGRAKDVKARVATLQTASPYLIELLFAVRSTCVVSDESLLHEVFSEHRAVGEWFELTSQDVENVKAQMVWHLQLEACSSGDVGDEDSWLHYMEGDYTPRYRTLF